MFDMFIYSYLIFELQVLLLKRKFRSYFIYHMCILVKFNEFCVYFCFRKPLRNGNVAITDQVWNNRKLSFLFFLFQFTLGKRLLIHNIKRWFHYYSRKAYAPLHWSGWSLCSGTSLHVSITYKSIIYKGFRNGGFVSILWNYFSLQFMIAIM